MEVNCIVNEDGAFPLEATARLGTPIIHLHSEIHSSPWSEFLYAIASGKQYDLKWKKGYGIVILVAVPPFPYTKRITENLVYNSNIYFDKMNERDLKHIHFEEVAIRKDDLNQFYIADSQGYVLYITGMGETIEEAQEKTYKIAKKVIVPKMFYRNDIGTSFKNEGLAKLKKLGYL
jgi:phosphoribosylamine--glycine ligase